VLAPLVDLVLPRRCVGCGLPGAGLCVGCLGRTKPLEVTSVSIPVYAGSSYGGAVRAAILRYKERGRRDLARPLSVLLTRAIVRVLERRSAGAGMHVVLVAVPSSRAAAAGRGGDHVARLARLAGMRAGVATAPHALRQVRRKADSAGLDVRARAANLAGVFAAVPAPAGVAAVIVDDIVTTGATVREAARALAGAGWPVLGAAVVAATPRRQSASTGSDAAGAQLGPCPPIGSPATAGLA
jgi:predicted amidophosphoribosyltransferase